MLDLPALFPFPIPSRGMSSLGICLNIGPSSLDSPSCSNIPLPSPPSANAARCNEEGEPFDPMIAPPLPALKGINMFICLKDIRYQYIGYG